MGSHLRNGSSQDPRVVELLLLLEHRMLHQELLLLLLLELQPLVHLHPIQGDRGDEKPSDKRINRGRGRIGKDISGDQEIENTSRDHALFLASLIRYLTATRGRGDREPHRVATSTRSIQRWGCLN